MPEIVHVQPCDDTGCECHRDPFDGPMCHTPARPPLPGRPSTGDVLEAMTGGAPLPEPDWDWLRDVG